MSPSPKSGPSRYFIFHKPYGVLSQFTPEHGARTLAEFGFPADIYPAGRLDKDSEGLLLLTDDGPLIKKLLEPRFEKQKTYWVQVEGIPGEEALERMRQGLVIQDYRTLPCQARLLPGLTLPPRDPPIRVRQSIPDCWLEIVLHEGKNRQVRRMTAAVGHPTLRLIRVGIGNLRLGDLATGKFREINRQDITL